MPGLDQILPSLQSLGVLAYWLIGLASLLEGFFFTGVIVPGTLITDAGGILVQRGVLDFFDLVWFVALGSVIGGEISFRVGRWMAGRLAGRFDPRSYAAFLRAEALFERRGPYALVIGRFAGPVAGFVPFAAALAAMPYRRFALWNIIGAIPFAFAHVSLGYFLGDMLSRLGTIASRILILMAVVGVTLGLLWLFVLRLRRGIPFFVSVLGSVRDGIASNPEVRSWLARHPRTTDFAAARFDRSRFAGLTATVLSLAFGYILFIYLGSVLDVLLLDPIVQVDARLASLIHAFWDPRVLRIATHITALGDWRTVTALLIGIVALLVAVNRQPLALGLSVTVLGDVVSVALLKRIFDRPRPALRYFVEHSGSFPSGHAAIAVAFYGSLCFTLWRLRLLGPVMAVLLAVSLAFLIGLSRIYLLEHYLSDVLNGYLIGALWLVIGIAFAEWQAERSGLRKSGLTVAQGWRKAALGLLLVSALGAGWVFTFYAKPLSIPAVAAAPLIATDVPALFFQGTLSAFTETIAGDPQEPINLVMTARTADDLAAAMERAGWRRADSPNIATLSRAAWAFWINQPDPNAPVTPYFWQGMPNDSAFQKPTADQTLRQRHHVRFWQTGIVTPDGDAIFVGAASFDDGMHWGVTHHIAPDVDAERDFLASDLQATGLIGSQSRFRATQPQSGENFNGDPWFTDGNAVQMTLAP